MKVDGPGYFVCLKLWDCSVFPSFSCPSLGIRAWVQCEVTQDLDVLMISTSREANTFNEVKERTRALLEFSRAILVTRRQLPELYDCWLSAAELRLIRRFL